MAQSEESKFAGVILATVVGAGAVWILAHLNRAGGLVLMVVSVLTGSLLFGRWSARDSGRNPWVAGAQFGVFICVVAFAGAWLVDVLTND